MKISKLELLPNEAAALSDCLDKAGIEWHGIAHVNWSEYPYKPEVGFRIAYDERHLYVQYRVVEATVRAMYGEDNGQVWTDSCCECFLQSPSSDVYYNIECNCIGTVLVGFGPGRNGRTLLDPARIATIQRYSTLGRDPFAEKEITDPWEMSLIIPLDLFEYLPKQLSGQTLKANFYKCGDELRTPHFLSWNPIHLPSPDFHRPDFFGSLEFD